MTPVMTQLERLFGEEKNSANDLTFLDQLASGTYHPSFFPSSPALQAMDAPKKEHKPLDLTFWDKLAEDARAGKIHAEPIPVLFPAIVRQTNTKPKTKFIIEGHPKLCDPIWNPEVDGPVPF